VLETIEHKDFFKTISYRLTFPEGFDLESTDFTKLEEQIKLEMEPQKISIVKNKTTKKWEQNEKNILAFINSIPYQSPERLNIILTKYGVGGSYWFPNKVVINIINARPDKFETVIHELVHLIIEKPIIQKYKVKHESKEA
jgi:Zn-dependent peptidase ImmA (M78 family)